MTTLLPGQIVRFSNPNTGEDALTFTVLEDRDTRALVASNDYCTEWDIRPTFVYAKTDLALVTDAS